MAVQFLLRLEFAIVAKELARSYSDGGQASGERQKRYAAPTADAYREAAHTVANPSTAESRPEHEVKGVDLFDQRFVEVESSNINEIAGGVVDHLANEVIDESWV